MQSTESIKVARHEAYRSAIDTLNLLRSGKLRKDSYIEKKMIEHYKRNRLRSGLLSWVLQDFSKEYELDSFFCKEDIDRFPCENQCDDCIKLMHETSVDILTEDLNIGLPKKD